MHGAPSSVYVIIHYINQPISKHGNNALDKCRVFLLCFVLFRFFRYCALLEFP